ncbi:hypothetical protein ACFL3G_07355 [Planctomycetota bacterium]
MHDYHDIFVRAIKDCSKIELTFFSKEDLAKTVKICAPIDYNPGHRAKDRSDIYYFLIFEDDDSSYVLPLPPNQILDIQITDQNFDATEITDLKNHWFISRPMRSLVKVGDFLKNIVGISKPNPRADRRESST